MCPHSLPTLHKQACVEASRCGVPGRSWASRCWWPAPPVPRCAWRGQRRSRWACPRDCCSPWCIRWSVRAGCCPALPRSSGRGHSGCRSPSAGASAAGPSGRRSGPRCSPSWRLSLEDTGRGNGGDEDDPHGVVAVCLWSEGWTLGYESETGLIFLYMGFKSPLSETFKLCVLWWIITMSKGLNVC